MGGTSMVGGLASIGGTVIGVFIISLLQQGIMAFGLGKGQQMIIHRTYRNCSSLCRRFCKTQKELIGREDVTMGEVIFDYEGH